MVKKIDIIKVSTKAQMVAPDTAYVIFNSSTGKAEFYATTNTGKILDTGSELMELEDFEVVAAEIIQSFIPVAIINGQAYRHKVTDPSHLNSFAGFSLTSSNGGTNIIVRRNGTISQQGWGLSQNQIYFAGIDGSINITAPTGVNFRRIVGRAETSDRLLIINDSPIKI